MTLELPGIMVTYASIAIYAVARATNRQQFERYKEQYFSMVQAQILYIFILPVGYVCSALVDPVDPVNNVDDGGIDDFLGPLLVIKFLIFAYVTFWMATVLKRIIWLLRRFLLPPLTTIQQCGY